MTQNNLSKEEIEEIVKYFEDSKYCISKQEIRKIILRLKYLNLSQHQIIKSIETIIFNGLVDPEM